MSAYVSQIMAIPHPSITLLFHLGDPLLRSLETTIVSTSLLKPSPSSVKKGGHTKQTKSSSVPTFPHPVLQLVLHDTVLFPEGGGQPSDIGILTTEDGVIWSIECIKRHGGVAVHYVNPADDISDVPNVFAPGKRVNLELGHTGFQRRLDHVSPPSLSCPSHTYVGFR
jgi:misacylated tRNA(Ala) deacylase